MPTNTQPLQKLFTLVVLMTSFLTSFFATGFASAQSSSLYLEDFRSNQNLLFEFGAFASGPSAFSFSSLGVTTNIPASSDSFGGLGVLPTSASVSITGTTAIEVVARANPGNQSDLVISIREAAAGGQTLGEFFSYTIPRSNFPVGGGFVTVTIDPTSGFNGDSTDGVLNGILRDTGIQSPFNGTAAHNYTIQSVNYIGASAAGGGATSSPEDGCLAPVQIHGDLSVSGTNIVDKNGNVVSFAGNSFFWSNTNFGAERLYNADVVGWLQEDWNSTIVRAAMGVDEFGGYLTDPQGNLNRVTAVVDAAIANDMYVIIDWHSHHAEDFQADAVAFFTAMARRYGDTPNVIYEIYNEPITRDWSGDIKPYSEAVIAAIRAEDPDNLIIVGTGFFSQDVDVASEDPITGFSNIAYTLHFYAGTHGQSLRDRAQTAIDNGLALMVTEWGTVNANGDGAVDRVSTEEWLLFMDLNNISHLNWSVHDKVEGASILRPGASSAGGWADSDLTESGLFVRDIIRNWFVCVETEPEVYLNATGFDADFRDEVDGSTTNDPTFGYQLTDANASQTVPYINIDEIVVDFGQAVDVGSLNVSDFALTGTGGTLADGSSASIPTITAVNVDANDATAVRLTLSGFLGPADLNLEVNASGITFGGTPGNDFSQMFSALPGDIDGSRAVLVSGDLIQTIGLLGTIIDDTDYPFRADLDGNGAVLVADLLQIVPRLGNLLPVSGP